MTTLQRTFRTLTRTPTRTPFALSLPMATTSTFRRTLTSTTPRLADAAPVRKPVGAFRGGMLGFFAGSTLAGAGVYYYILDEYRVSNQVLSEDIYSLQAAVQRTETYVRALEERVAQMGREKK